MEDGGSASSSKEELVRLEEDYASFDRACARRETLHQQGRLGGGVLQQGTLGGRGVYGGGLRSALSIVTL
jgi:hypothetical protein